MSWLAEAGPWGVGLLLAGLAVAGLIWQVRSGQFSEDAKYTLWPEGEEPDVDEPAEVRADKERGDRNGAR